MNISTAPLQDQAYDIIKDMILNEELERNQLYSETKLAKDLEISRTPLRGALRGLEQDGYIVIAPSRGFMIRTLDRQGLKESIEIRAAIEGYCAYRLAGEEPNEENKKLIARLGDIIAELEKVSKDDSKINEYIELDHEFHMQIINHIGNQIQLSQIQRIYYLMKQTSKEALKQKGRGKATHDEHVKVFKAIKERKPEEAYKAMLSHLYAPLELPLKLD